MIQDEKALLEHIDYEVMARIYEWQAMAADPDLDPSYRNHYRKRLAYVGNEINAILSELYRAEQK